jgi:hypothetical protein
VDTQTHWVTNGFTVCARVLLTASLLGDDGLKEHYFSRLSKERKQLQSLELGDDTA